MQAEIDLAAPEVETTVLEPEPWPSDTATRALRRVLREADRPMTVESVDRRFMRAPRATIAELLASLGQARHADTGYAA